MEVHNTKNPWTYLEIKKLKVKVTRPINTHAVNAHHLSNGKAYELQTWYTAQGPSADWLTRLPDCSLSLRTRQPAMHWRSTLSVHTSHRGDNIPFWVERSKANKCNFILMTITPMLVHIWLTYGVGLKLECLLVVLIIAVTVFVVRSVAGMTQ